MVDVLTDPAVVAVFFTIVGGILLKVMEKWLARNAHRVTERQEHRDEVTMLRERLDKEEAEVEAWRKKAFAAEETLHQLRLQFAEYTTPQRKPQDTDGDA